MDDGQLELRPYPVSPGVKSQDDTTVAAAQAMEDRAGTLRARVLAALRAVAMTADETAEELGEDILAIRPRFSELRARGRVEATAARRRNASGRLAIVWRAKA